MFFEPVRQAKTKFATQRKPESDLCVAHISGFLPLRFCILLTFDFDLSFN
jgi:hypothetical protein